MIKHKIEKSLESYFLEDEFENCYLIEIKESQGGNRIEVYIDSDEDLSYTTLRRMSRRLEAEIEENEWMPEKYTLEVSSPGIGRPLTHHRQYVKNINRHIEVEMKNDTTIKGVLKKVSEEEIEVEVTLPKKSAKIKGVKTENIMIRKEDILKARIKISFK